jgi:hypothetical protein
MIALLHALANAVRGWRPIRTFNLGPGYRVDVWLEIPSAQGGAIAAHRFRLTDAWRSGDGDWRHNDGTPLRADFISHWRRRPLPPGGRP